MSHLFNPNARKDEMSVPQVTAQVRRELVDGRTPMWRGYIAPAGGGTTMFTTMSKFANRRDMEQLLRDYFNIVGDIEDTTGHSD